MPSVSLDLTPPRTHVDQATLPTLLHTPSGLAIVEIQGTIHAPFPDSHDLDRSLPKTETPVGRLEFPLYDSHSDASDLKWMKRVYLYVGEHQRLTGEVKKLPKPMAVIAKKTKPFDNSKGTTMPHERDNRDMEGELEVLEVVRYKILFGGRPEPVGG